MLSPLRTLLLVSMLCARTRTTRTTSSSSSISSLCLSLYPGSDVLCAPDPDRDRDRDRYQNQVLSPDARANPSYSDKWGSLLRSSESLSLSSSSSSSSSSSAEQRGKRTSGPPNYRILSQTKLRSKVVQGGGRSDRRSKFTLSLDVPTNIMNILFDMAKARNLRAKAADNARLLAQIGRRRK